MLFKALRFVAQKNQFRWQEDSLSVRGKYEKWRKGAKVSEDKGGSNGRDSAKDGDRWNEKSGGSRLIDFGEGRGG